MVYQLLKRITMMCVCIMLGVVNWLMVVLCSTYWWAVCLNIFATIFAFFVAYLIYKSAKKLAMQIDFEIKSIDYKVNALLEILSFISTKNTSADTNDKPKENESEVVVHPV